MTRLAARALLGLATLGLSWPAQAQAGGQTPAANSPKLVQVDPRNVPELGRTIALNMRNVSMDVALQTIAEKASLRLTYSRELLPAGRKISLSSRSIEVDEALRTVLQDSGLDILALSSGQVVVIRKGERPPRGAGSLVGLVTDSVTGRGLATTDVIVEKMQRRTTTDTAGRYQLANIEAGSYNVTFRRLGYRVIRRAVTIREGGVDTLNVTLATAPSKLDDLVSTATGQQRRRDIGTPITTINADSVLRTAPVRNLTDLLENRVPGLDVIRTTGAPGDPARYRLHGLGSPLRSNDPVVIVDGVRVYSAQTGPLSGNLTNLAPLSKVISSTQGIQTIPAGAPAPSPLDQIDPNTIEKIEVMSGAAAATLYGADAANGVMVITTKRGKPGPTRWDASFTRSVTSSPGQYPVGYYRWGHDTTLGGLAFPTGYYCTLRDYYCAQDSLMQFQAMNQPKFTVLGHGHRTGVSLTASGGTQSVMFNVTGSYANDVGLLQLPDYEVDRFRATFNKEAPDWMRRPHNFKDWQVTSNVRLKVAQKADVTLITSLTRGEQQRTTLEDQLARLSGTYIDTINGTYYRPSVGQENEGIYRMEQVTDGLLNSYYTQRTASQLTIRTGVNAQWYPRPSLDFSGSASVFLEPRNDRLLLRPGFVTATDSGLVSVSDGRVIEGSFDLRGSWKKPMGHGFVFITRVGTNVVTTNTNAVSTAAGGLVPGTTSLTGALRVASFETEARRSVFGWYVEPSVTSQRLSFSTGLRLDGGSAYGVRFGRTGGDGRGVFGFLKDLLLLPKFNGSWVISEEPWFPASGFISSLQLRGAFGQAQNQPEVTDRLRLYTNRTVTGGGTDLALSSLGNSALRPERSTELSGGFVADLLNSRVSVDINFYREQVTDALLQSSLPLSVNGGGTVFMNVGNTRNTGVDLQLTVTPVRMRAVTWGVNLVYNRNNNILTKLGDGVAANKLQGIVEGFPIASRWARPIVGFADENGDGVLQSGEIQVGDSLVYMGRLLPAYTTRFGTNLGLFGGALQFTANFSYDFGQTQIDQTLRTNWVLVRPLVDPTAPLAQQAAVWASTRPTNPTDYGLMHQISTLRFTSASMNYRAPQQVAQFFRATNLTMSLRGSNLGLHSTYPGKDPNVTAWSAGENIVDTGQLPAPRIWELAVYLGF